MPARQMYSDEAILRALRAAADRCGEPLSHGRYDAVATVVGGPTATRIIQRFGSWREACAAAGVRAGAPHREYDQAWNPTTVTAAVRAYLGSQGCPGTYAGYVAWAREDAGRPSGATVRNVMGGWSAAKSAAVASTHRARM